MMDPSGISLLLAPVQGFARDCAVTGAGGIPMNPGRDSDAC